jgi:hypothetical protein
MRKIFIFGLTTAVLALGSIEVNATTIDKANARQGRQDPAFSPQQDEIYQGRF